MPEYTVYLSKGTEISVRVEAEDVDAAIDKAYEVDVSGICAQCSGWGKKWGRDESDDMEPTAVIDESTGKTVWDSAAEAPKVQATPAVSDDSGAVDRVAKTLYGYEPMSRLIPWEETSDVMGSEFRNRATSALAALKGENQ